MRSHISFFPKFVSPIDYYRGRKRLEQTWRWFGPNDPVQLSHVAQAGATGVVSALHHIPNGKIWPLEEIEQRKAMIEAAGLRWSVVESVHVQDDIKRRSGRHETYIENYCTTLRNLGRAGIDTVCYNFMPVLDWTRTDLAYPQPDGSTALRFERLAYVAFDMEILKRAGAEADYAEEEIELARKWLSQRSESEVAALVKTVIAGLPGSEEGYTLDGFREILRSYDEVGAQDLRENLVGFIRSIVEVAEENGITMTIHPDDPPFPMFGLPRIMSTLSDAEYLFSQVENPANALCFCTGSFGVRADNDLPAMAKALAPRIGFIHLRSTLRDAVGNFHEANHLDGDVDMFAVMTELSAEQQRRTKSIPMRPDHGHAMLDDLAKVTNPGYSGIGRLRGLAELRGLELGVIRGMP